MKHLTRVKTTSSLNAVRNSDISEAPHISRHPGCLMRLMMWRTTWQDEKLGVWRAPYVNAFFDTRLVRRSNMLQADLVTLGPFRWYDGPGNLGTVFHHDQDSKSCKKLASFKHTLWFKKLCFLFKLWHKSNRRPPTLQCVLHTWVVSSKSLQDWRLLVGKTGDILMYNLSTIERML